MSEMRQRYFRQAELTITQKTKWFKAGDFRTPKKGERFITGAIPEAYLAPEDLDIEYFIAVEIEPPKQEIEIDGWVYRFYGPAVKGD
jgi:hypothetical protein